MARDQQSVRRTRSASLRLDRARGLRPLLGAAVAGALLFGGAPAFAQGGGCSREDMQKIADAYLAAQKSGDPSKIPMGLWVDYQEQMEMGTMSTGVLSKPLKIDFSRTLLDPQSCSAFVEVIAADPADPRVLGVMLQARGGQLNAVQVIATDKQNGWLFNAANTLKYSKAENWSEIPEAQRDSRETIVAAANAYLDAFNDKNAKVPWGAPCARLEGGVYTAKGGPGVAQPTDTCNVGVPSGVKIVNRTYVVDPTIGAVAVLANFGGNSLPDVHTFRVEGGKIRYIHTITVCKTANCGLKIPPELQAQLSGG